MLDNGNAPESFERLVGVGVVLLLSIVVVVALGLAMICRRFRVAVARYPHHVVDGLSLTSLAALGTAFAVYDMSFNIGESTEAVSIALTLGFVAAGPLFLQRAGGLRRLLVAILVYGAFAGWIVVQRHIDWNVRRPFVRAYAMIRPGMTREQVEAALRQELRGKRLTARSDTWGVQYTLDPDDGRFNSEFIIIEMIEGRVVSTRYSPD